LTLERKTSQFKVYIRRKAVAFCLTSQIFSPVKKNISRWGFSK